MDGYHQNSNMWFIKYKINCLCCETLGDTEIGKCFGLNQALKNAGVKNIISSLWKVDDEATVEFMLDFYKELIDNNIHYALKSAITNTKKSISPLLLGTFYLCWVIF